MHAFAHPLELGQDGEEPVFGLSIAGEVNAFVFDPFSSECMRFEVDPVQTYGISLEDAHALVALNASLREAAAAAHQQQADGALSLHQVAQQIAQRVLREREAVLGPQGDHALESEAARAQRPAAR